MFFLCIASLAGCWNCYRSEALLSCGQVNSMATATPCVGPPSTNNCLLSLKRISTANFSTHQVLIRIFCFLRACSPIEDNASHASFIIVIQRNPPKGQRHFIGQSEPGLHLCLAHLYTRSLLLYCRGRQMGKPHRAVMLGPCMGYSGQKWVYLLELQSLYQTISGMDKLHGLLSLPAQGLGTIGGSLVWTN